MCVPNDRFEISDNFYYVALCRTGQGCSERKKYTIKTKDFWYTTGGLEQQSKLQD